MTIATLADIWRRALAEGSREFVLVHDPTRAHGAFGVRLGSGMSYHVRLELDRVAAGVAEALHLAGCALPEAPCPGRSPPTLGPLRGAFVGIHPSLYWLNRVGEAGVMVQARLQQSRAALIPGPVWLAHR